MEQPCPEFLQPRLRLFLSADIVGSTGLKQTPLGATPKEILEQHTLWFSVIQGFYIEAAQAFNDEWRTAQAASGEELLFGDQPRLWKTLGDEVLFEKVILDHRQVEVTIKCWIRALDRMRRFLREKSKRLDVKSTAWLAGFPVVNKEVVLDLRAQEQPSPIDNYAVESGRVLNAYYKGETPSGFGIDFIGPAIDTGFRLASHATSRKLVVSVGLALFLSRTTEIRTKGEVSMRLMFGGAVQLKGVLGGLSYPLFWIDLSEVNSLARQEDELTSATPVKREAIRSYCEAFYEENDAYIFAPFVDQVSEQQMSARPAWYDEIHRNMIKTFYAEAEGYDPEAEQRVEDGVVGPLQSQKSIDESIRDVKRMILIRPSKTVVVETKRRRAPPSPKK